MEINKNKNARIYLLAFNKEDLKEICKNFKIKGFSKLKKEDIINLIIKAIPKDYFPEFYKQIEKKALRLIISNIPKYFLKENPTKLHSITYNKENQSLELFFRGFTWEINTHLQFLNLNNRNEPFKFNSNCTCEYAKENGLCSHFWTALVWFFQKFSLQPSRWTRGPLPDEFLNLIKSIDFSTYEKTDFKKTIEIKEFEHFLKMNLMGKTEFKFEDLEQISISEIQRFMEIVKLQIPFQNKKKPKKSDLINYIKLNISEKEFSRKFFQFKKQFRISEAVKIPIEGLKVSWGPPLNCEGKLKMSEKNGGHIIINISIKNDKIQHGDCHWIYHRSNLCEHLLAFFLLLAKEDEQKTLRYLERFLES